MASVESLTRKGDAASVVTLMEIGNASVYMRYAAVQLLGLVSDPTSRREILDYLTPKLTDPDSQVATAAISAYGKHTGKETVPGLSLALTANRTRADGYEEQICTCIVECLAATSDSSAAGPLAAELDRIGQGVWGLSYGSIVVNALGRIGTAEGRVAVGRYADRLTKQVPQDPLARRDYEEMIAQARAIADAPTGKGTTP